MRNKFSLLLSGIGLELLYRGVTGFSPVYALLGKNSAVHNKRAAISVPHEQGFHLSESITINRPVAEVYAYLRDLRNFPTFMQHVESVEVQNAERSHWRVKGPAGLPVEWDAMIISEEANERLGWRSLKNPYIDHAGSIRVKPAPGQFGTEVHLTMEYAPLAGHVSRLLLGLLGKAPEQQIGADLRRLKQLLEVGEIATTEGQSSARGQS
ncbi:MAG: cyclase [Anaerolineae bacterium]|nr:cyclase [Anaerolineae bacterium]